MEYDRSDLDKAVRFGFHYVESLDEIVRAVYVTPEIGKQIVLAMPSEVHFDYIPEGIGMLRTAYLKFMPSVKANEIRFINQDNDIELRLYLI